MRLTESCFNNSIFLAFIFVYGCKYTKFAVKTPQILNIFAVFLPQNTFIANYFCILLGRKPHFCSNNKTTNNLLAS